MTETSNSSFLYLCQSSPSPLLSINGLHKIHGGQYFSLSQNIVTLELINCEFATAILVRLKHPKI